MSHTFGLQDSYIYLSVNTSLRVCLIVPIIKVLFPLKDILQEVTSKVGKKLDSLHVQTKSTVL